MGKAEGKGELWHGHVTAVTVAPEYRRLGKVRFFPPNKTPVCLYVWNDPPSCQ